MLSKDLFALQIVRAKAYLQTIKHGRMKLYDFCIHIRKLALRSNTLQKITDVVYSVRTG
jgi:hypothetical protein